MTTPVVTRKPIPNGWQLSLRMSHGGQESVCVFGFVGPAGAVVSPDAQALLQAVWNQFRPLIASAVTCTGGTLRSQADGAKHIVELQAPTNPAGVVTTEQTVAAASLLFKWQTANGTRSGKGRTYLPGVPEASILGDGRTLAPATITQGNTIAQQYEASENIAGLFTPAVLSFKDGAARPITSGALSPVPAIQRRRMR